jgi:hypothetical protein
MNDEFSQSFYLKISCQSPEEDFVNKEFVKSFS